LDRMRPSSSSRAEWRGSSSILVIRNKKSSTVRVNLIVVVKVEPLRTIAVCIRR
jgi:hypothetical protein